MVEVFLILLTHSSVNTMASLLVTGLESPEIGEQGGDDSAYLSDGVASFFLVHDIPFKFVESLEGFADLDNNVEGVVRQIVKHVVHHTVLFFATEGIDGKGGVSEVAVLIVLEHKISDRVPRLSEVFKFGLPEISSDIHEDFIKTADFFGNPTSEAFRGGFFDGGFIGTCE
jgi:hypothetical protein